jgi:GcrA cell cycle regulator
MTRGRGTKIDWSDNLVEQLKDLWAEGKSASQIARALGGGHTRSAVIGKAHRLKLLGRAKPERKPAAFKMPSNHGTARNRKVLPLPIQREAHPDPLLTTDGDKITMLTVSDRTCRWPHGDPLDADFHFCGHVPKEGRPYCEAHCQRAAAKKFLSEDPDAPQLQRRANNQHQRMFG